MIQNALPDFDNLWRHVEDIFALGLDSLHGPHHWRRVEQFGLQLAAENGADVIIVRLFAVMHDCQRWDENTDEGHGVRGAAYAQHLHGTFFHLDESRFQLLYEAIAGHEDGETTKDITIGTCWDADRLDLGRVGISPSPHYLSTREAKRLVQR